MSDSLCMVTGHFFRPRKLSAVPGALRWMPPTIEISLSTGPQVTSWKSFGLPFLNIYTRSSHSPMEQEELSLREVCGKEPDAEELVK